jgi:hypothetical protein
MLGKITISSDSAKLCKLATTDLAEDRLETGDLDTSSCLKADPKYPGVELVLPASADSIKHGLVRAYFSVVFTTMAESEFSESKKALIPKNKSVDLKQLEMMIKNALTQDLKGKGPVNDELFENPVDAVIEAADQYYCSPATRTVFRSDKYENTYKVFKEYYVDVIHEGGERTPEEIYNEVRKSKEVAASSKGLGLWGRWGRGNGPLRAWGRARMSARRQGGRGLFPRWNLARQRGYAAGGRGAFPNWNLSRRRAYAAGGRGWFPNVNLHRRGYRRGYYRRGYALTGQQDYTVQP